MTNIKDKTNKLISLDQNKNANKPMVDYNSASNQQLKWIEDGKLNIQKAVPLLPPHDGIIHIMDFGCSHGINSMFVMKQLLDEIQKREGYTKDLKEMIFYHEDLPDNDFDAVMSCVSNPEIGYPFHDLIKSKNIKVHTECIGYTYYEQIVKSNSVDIAFCYTSLHWMPEYLPSEYGVTYSRNYGDEELTRWFDNMSSRYLNKWLDMRHRELKESGLLSINIMTAFNYAEWVNPCWVEVLKRRGLDHRNFMNVVVPAYFRSHELVQHILYQNQHKFKLNHLKNIKDSSNWSRDEFRAITRNQIVSGLAKYPDNFPNELSREALYYELENLCFNILEYSNLESEIEWIVLQKI